MARFRYYAIADGIREILSGRVKRVFEFETDDSKPYLQLDFIEMLDFLPE